MWLGDTPTEAAKRERLMPSRASHSESCMPRISASLKFQSSRKFQPQPLDENPSERAECLPMSARRSRRKVDTRPRPNFIWAWRRERAMSQETLAALTSVSVSSISQLEHGKQGFSDKTLKSIADALEVQAGWLLSRDPTDPDDVWTLAEQIRALPVDKREQLRRMIAVL
jgi:transcriptional regulator with XRE-family HTH domain